MKKYIILVILCLTFIGCAEENNTHVAQATNPNNVSSYRLGWSERAQYSVITDNETGVQYIVADGSRAGREQTIAITPRFDSNGKIMVVDK